MPGRLCPFALWTALPSSLVRRESHDYYGHSVTLGLAPRRQSRVRLCCTSERDLGAPLISLIALTGQRSTLRRLRRQESDVVAGRGAGVGCRSGGRCLASSGDWGLGSVAFAISRGSHDASPLTPGLDRRFAGMRLSLSPFGSGLAIRPKNLPPSSSRLSRGYNRAPRGASFLACCCPVHLSDPGKPLDPRTSLRVPPS